MIFQMIPPTLNSEALTLPLTDRLMSITPLLSFNKATAGSAVLRLPYDDAKW